MKDEVDDAKEKLRLIREKISEAFEKDEQLKEKIRVKELKPADLEKSSEEALMVAFDMVFYKKFYKKMAGKTYKKISIEKLKQLEHEIYMEWLGFEPYGEEEKGEKIKTEEVQRLPYVPINFDFYNIVPYIIPYRITDKNLQVRKILEDGSLSLVFRLKTRDKTVIFSFLIPAEIIEKIRKRDVPMVGINMQRALFAMLGFVFVQGNPVSFRRSDLLKVMGEDTHKSPSLYRDLLKGLLTWAYGTYTIIDNDKVLEVGHIVNTLRLPKKRGGEIVVDFNPDVVKPLLRSMIEEEKTCRFVPYPMDFIQLKPRDMDLHIRNFCESILTLKGLGNSVYPKQVENYLIKDFGFSPKQARKLKKAEISTLIEEGCNTAKEKKLLVNWKFTRASVKKYPFNIRKWKLKVVVP